MECRRLLNGVPQAERTVIIVKQLQAHETQICDRGPAAAGGFKQLVLAACYSLISLWNSACPPTASC